MEDIIYLLKKYASEKMTLALLRQAAKIEDNYILAVFIASAYNNYMITRCQEQYGLITNIDALKINENEFQLFLEDFKAYVKDTIQTKDYEKKRNNEIAKVENDGTNA